MMKNNSTKNLPLVRLPQEAELALFIIQQELRGRKLTHRFNGSVCISDFSSLIFNMIGFNDPSDQFYKWYLGQLDVFCKDIDLSDDTTLTQQAFDFYIHLLMEKRG